MTNRLEVISSQLDRTLAFFERAEQKAAVVVGFDLGLVAIAFLNLDYLDISTWYVVIPVLLSISLIAASFGSLYLGMYPRLDGGSESLFYFNEVGKMSETRFIDRFSASDDIELQRDMLGQV